MSITLFYLLVGSVVAGWAILVLMSRKRLGK
jgi:hypothetical protein